MTKCDFCPVSTLNKDGKLICDYKTTWRCEEAIKKMMKCTKLIVNTNDTKIEKTRVNKGR